MTTFDDFQNAISSEIEIPVGHEDELSKKDGVEFDRLTKNIIREALNNAQINRPDTFHPEGRKQSDIFHEDFLQEDIEHTPQQWVEYVQGAYEDPSLEERLTAGAFIAQLYRNDIIRSNQANNPHADVTETADSATEGYELSLQQIDEDESFPNLTLDEEPLSTIQDELMSPGRTELYSMEFSDDECAILQNYIPDDMWAVTYDLFVVDSYEGFMTEIYLLDQLGKEYELPVGFGDSKDESKGIDGRVGGVRISVKPRSYFDDDELADNENIALNLQEDGEVVGGLVVYKVLEQDDDCRRIRFYYTPKTRDLLHEASRKREVEKKTQKKATPPRNSRESLITNGD